MRYPRYICIHGHFYQPPRENPWLDAVEVEDSAAPFHDWNERITRECYAPNSRSRILDQGGRIINLLDNYTWMSFNFGPTLLHWLAEHEPAVLEAIVEADRLSIERRRGHGNALAQVYNHMIMPLASRHDRETQVAWGIADFRHRFGRGPEGMWLPETAVDVESLEVLAEAGILFTILAPSQARRWRKLGTREWHDDPGTIDPSRAYLCRLASGRSIVLFFYDANVSHQVAFERLLDDGERFLQCLNRGFEERRGHAQLMHIATDGESYGHHHPHGDMALAYVFNRLAEGPEVRLTNYGEFLELHPPEWEAEIHDNSSWSCAHGIERWRADCGCRNRGEWHQRWRGPLRQALDGLKLQLDHVYGTRGRAYFQSPWNARDAYIEVLLDRDSDEAIGRFIARHGHADLDADQVAEALRLLEMQRDAMLMFTSCGWFHDELSGIETIQCLQYAARAIYLAKQLQRDFEPEFVAALAKAPSNLPRYQDGRGVWEQVVRPAVVDLERVLAHHAISLIYRPPGQGPKGRVYSFDLDTLDLDVRSRASGHVAIGRLKARSRRIGNQAEAQFVVIHFGGLDFHAVLNLEPDPATYEEFKSELMTIYRRGSLADVTTLVARKFPGRSHRLDDLFRDEQWRIIGIVLEDRIADYERSFELLANQDEEVLNRLGQLAYPIPKSMRAAASSYLDTHLGDEIGRLVRGAASTLDGIENLVERGRAWSYRPERDGLEKTLAEAMLLALDEIRPGAELSPIIGRVEMLIYAGKLLGLEPNLWQVQNRLLTAFVELSERSAMVPSLRADFARLAEGLKLSARLLGWRP